jgi:hypothetical protein
LLQAAVAEQTLDTGIFQAEVAEVVIALQFLAN